MKAKFKYSLSIIFSILVGIALIFLLYHTGNKIISSDTSKWLASISATMAGFVFTVEQLLIIIIGNNESRVSRILRKHNPEYIKELLRITESAIIGYFFAALINSLYVLFNLSYSSVLSLLGIFLITFSSSLMFFLVLNVQLVYEDYLELDLKVKFFR